MFVEILHIDYERTKNFAEGRVVGLSGVFQCPFLIGSAWFVPATSSYNNLVEGNWISVESNYELITNFHVLSNSKPIEMELLEEKNYRVVGTVSLIAEELIIVDVDDFSFRITFDEIYRAEVCIGECVEFNLLGLSLWDENV